MIIHDDFLFISILPAFLFLCIVEDSLQQLHEIHEAIQAMREPTTCLAGYIGGNPLLRLQQCARMSASCPSLNEAPLPDLPFLDSHGSVGSSPLHLPNSRKGSGKKFILVQLVVDTIYLFNFRNTRMVTVPWLTRRYTKKKIMDCS